MSARQSEATVYYGALRKQGEKAGRDGDTNHACILCIHLDPLCCGGALLSTAGDLWREPVRTELNGYDQT